MIAWIGKSLVGIGVIHSLFGFVVFRGIINVLVSEGLFNTVNNQPEREQAFWFLFTGFAWIILGLLVDWLEKSSNKPPSFLGWAFLTMTVVGAFIMPISGIWLFFVLSVGLLCRNKLIKKSELTKN
jgi:hypothetical protein